LPIAYAHDAITSWLRPYSSTAGAGGSAFKPRFASSVLAKHTCTGMDLIGILDYGDALLK